MMSYATKRAVAAVSSPPRRERVSEPAEAVMATNVTSSAVAIT